MKSQDLEPNKALEKILELENAQGQMAFDINRPEEIKVQIRANETVAPAKFKPDPIIFGGYIANSLTIRAMRPDIFVLGDSLEDLASSYECPCGETFDLQFWKLCPYCARDIKC